MRLQLKSRRHPYSYLALYRLSLAMNNRVWSNDAIRRWIRFHNFELNRTHGAASREIVALAQRTIRFGEIRLQEYLEQITETRDALAIAFQAKCFLYLPCQPFDCIIDRQNMNAFSVLDVRQRLDPETRRFIYVRFAEAEKKTYVTTSPKRTRKFFRITRFIRIFSFAQASSDKTMQTVSFLRFPLIITVSPRNSCNSSIFA